MAPIKAYIFCYNEGMAELMTRASTELAANTTQASFTVGERLQIQQVNTHEQRSA